MGNVSSCKMTFRAETDCPCTRTRTHAVGRQLLREALLEPWERGSGEQPQQINMSSKQVSEFEGAEIVEEMGSSGVAVQRAVCAARPSKAVRREPPPGTQQRYGDIGSIFFGGGCETQRSPLKPDHGITHSNI